MKLDEIWKVAAITDFRWLLLAVAAYATALFCRILRWSLILAPTTSMTIPQTAMALFTGYAMNSILPMRLGELFRADFCRRQYGVPRSTALGTIAVERIVDGLIVVALLFLGLTIAETANATLATFRSVFVAGAVLFGSAAFALLLVGSDWVSFILEKAPRSIKQHLYSFQSGVRMVRTSQMLLVLTGSILVWCFDGLAIWAILKACSVDPTFFQTCLAIGVISLATLLPGPPGFVGTMQFAFVLICTTLGYSSSQGIVAATAAQVFLLLPMVVFGLTLLLRQYLAGTSQLRAMGESG